MYFCIWPCVVNVKMTKEMVGEKKQIEEKE